MKIINAVPGLFLVGLVCILPACSPSCVLRPTEAFDGERLAAAPDYGDREAWAALPDGDDKADFTPPESVDRQAEAPVDVFYVHPTTWFDREVWNDSLDSEKSKEMVDDIIMPGQASAFNECCRIFAPYYRQATIGAYFADPQEATRAFSVAYDDVERAFETFVEEHSDGRPFILAAHSQGSMHAMRLLERIDNDPALRERMVTAYVVGFALPMPHYEEVYEHLQPCEEPDQTGCVVAWDTYVEGVDADGADSLLFWSGDEVVEVSREIPRQCTNPVTWRADESPSPIDAHLGAVKRINEGDDPSFWKVLRSKDAMGIDVTGLEEPRSGLFSARCQDGVLRVPDLGDLDYDPSETSPGNYHLIDYEIFYMDIRANALERSQSWVDARAGAGREDGRQ